MKKFCLYIFILVWQKASSQIDLKIECSPNNVKSKKELNFILSISNTSEQNIEISKSIIVLPKSNTDADFWYEIIFFDKLDSTNITNSIRTHIQRRRLFESKISLVAGEIFYFKPDIVNGYFDRPGKYKVRFIARKISFDSLKEDIYSNWINFYIESDISSN